MNQGIRIETLLEEVINRKASDLHLQVGLSPVFRVDGELLVGGDGSVMDEKSMESVVYSMLDDRQREILLKYREFDFGFTFGSLGRFRVNVFYERGNLAAAFRLIPNELKTITELGMPSSVANFANLSRGLVLITGPAGSGKSTTLASLINKINEERSQYIITIEDPIEFIHKSNKSVIAQREVHHDTESFATALRSSLRQDPDVVLIGEMRDLETIYSAITIAETGHLVFATLHTNSASQSIDRMIGAFPPHQQSQIRYQLANVLKAVCSQCLVPAIQGGRVPASEVFIVNSASRNLIREGKNYQLNSVIQTGSDVGMQTLDNSLVDLVRSGKVRQSDARERATDVNNFDRLARG